MWRSKKFIIVTVLAAVILTGSITGVALAQTGDEENDPQAQQEALLDKVCRIYEENTGTAIDAQALKDAFAQAQSEIRDEALDSYLQKLVEEGEITQEEADEYLEWWQSRPDSAIGFGFMGHGGPMGMVNGRGRLHTSPSE